MEQEQSRVVVQVARYGLPAVVIIFYVTATLKFDYTPDSTFLALGPAGGSLSALGGGAAPSPLWQMLIQTGSWFHVSGLLTAKVLALFFSSCIVVLTYILGVEVLGDRLLALCASLTLALEPPLLQLAPSGSPASLGLLLGLAALFFVLRNEYGIAAIIIGLCTLVLWQAVVLTLLVAGDIWLNSLDALRARKAMLSVVMISIGILSAGLFLTVLLGGGSIPVLIPFGDFSPVTFRLVGKTVALVLLAGAGVIAAWMSGPEGRLIVRTHIVPLLWMVWIAFQGILGHAEVWLLALPPLVLYAFWGLGEIVQTRGWLRYVHLFGFAFAAVLLMLSQVEYLGATNPCMREATEASSQLTSIALWLKTHSVDTTKIASDSPGILGYYAQRSVDPLHTAPSREADFIVIRVTPHQGYEKVFQPVEVELGNHTRNYYAVWRRR